MSSFSPSARLEAFSDGVFAIAITLLVIDIKIPPTADINSNHEFWLALGHIAPSIFAFVLSFVVILITWVNHHNFLRIGNKVSNAFIYANGFMLLTVAFMPFPTSLLGEYVLTDHATPAVVLYDSVMALQGLSWILVTQTAIKGRLGKDEKAMSQIQSTGKFAYFAFILYTILTILAIWFPLSVAVVTTLTWIFWLIYGINIRQE